MMGSRGVMSGGKRFFQVASALLAAVLSFELFAAENETVIAVISVRDKKNITKVYQNIAEGIEQSVDSKVKQYTLNDDFSEQELMENLARDSVDVVIGLGSKSAKAASAISPHYPVLMGAVRSIDLKGVGGVTLHPSAEVILDKLHMLAPHLERLNVVYSPMLHKDVIAEAKKIALQKKIKFRAFPSLDKKQTQAAIEQIFSDVVAGKEAIWIVSGTKKSTDISNNLIKESWRKHVVLFSFSPKHLELFPFVFVQDWRSMGGTLGNMAENILQGGKAEVSALKDMKLWVNEQKSRHYGLRLDSETRRQIDHLYKQ